MEIVMQSVTPQAGEQTFEHTVSKDKKKIYDTGIKTKKMYQENNFYADFVIYGQNEAIFCHKL